MTLAVRLGLLSCNTKDLWEMHARISGLYSYLEILVCRDARISTFHCNSKYCDLDFLFFFTPFAFCILIKTINHYLYIMKHS